MKLVEYFCDRLNDLFIFAKMLKNLESEIFLHHSISHAGKVFKKLILVLFGRPGKFLVFWLFSNSFIERFQLINDRRSLFFLHKRQSLFIKSIQVLVQLQRNRKSQVIKLILFDYNANYHFDLVFKLLELGGFLKKPRKVVEIMAFFGENFF